MPAPARLPKSVAAWYDPILMLGLTVELYIVLRNMPLDTTWLSFIICAAVLVLLSGLELWRGPWRNAPWPKQTIKTVLTNTGIAWIGTMAGIVLTLLFWWLIPEYRELNYIPLFRVGIYLLPTLPFITAIWIFVTEWRLGVANDASRNLGLLTLGRLKEVNWKYVRLGLFSWFIKGFFLPLNFCWLVRLIERFRFFESTVPDMEWPKMVGIVDDMVLAALAVAIIPAYSFSVRLLNTQIRKVDYSWFGWVVTLSCYEPWHSGMMRGWLSFRTPAYGATKAWVLTLAGMPTLLYVAGGLVLFFEALHYWGESIFGLRASNLSHRGIITNGPFRFCKHPVYVVKCFGWCTVTMPFAMGSTVFECIRFSILFLGVCSVYYMRAWVEERMLSEDPTYVAYASWVDDHGIFAFIGRKIPVFSFKWRLARWVKMRQQGFEI